MKPLAERMRPQKLDDYIGQEHIMGSGAVLRQAIESGNIPSFILWGNPGIGKTSLAKLISVVTDSNFYALSAINSGVKDIREVFEKIASANKQTDKIEENSLFSATTSNKSHNEPNNNRQKSILFIDEIHRFSKSQQDSLLKAVEEGLVTLIGATTENPSFEVNSALLSRCQVYTLNPLTKEQLVSMVDKAIKEDAILSKQNITVKEYDAMLRYSSGDARRLYNILELASNLARNDTAESLIITNKLIAKICQSNPAIYDKTGELHYDIISAFIKSIRGSDPNATVYWLARMLEGGEDIKFIARRIIISAAEDIGLANPNALVIAQATFDAINVVGMPEARIILSQAAIYLANSPKSNATYTAINDAISLVKQTGDLPVPLHLRNAPTELMQELSYGKGYKYAHDYQESQNFIEQEYLPDYVSATKNSNMQHSPLYKPQNNPNEQKHKERLNSLWQGKYGY